MSWLITLRIASDSNNIDNEKRARDIGNLVQGIAERTATLLSVVTGKVEVNMSTSSLDAAISDLKAKVAAEKTVVDSAIVYIKSVPQLISDAVAKASAAGATAVQLQALTDLSGSLSSESANLQAALTANTPGPAPINENP